MTAREVYIDILTELVKEEAPTLYIEDFLYYLNKAISEYLKTRYELYETNQQLADDLRVWKREKTFNSLSIPIDSIHTTSPTGIKSGVYRHVLGLVYDTTVLSPTICCKQTPFMKVTHKVSRMSAEIKVGMLDNAYLKPTFYRPYFELIGNYIRIDTGDVDVKKVKIDNIVLTYLCQPAAVDLTEEQVDDIKDTSQVLEFSDDVAEEIVKKTLTLILERGSSSRLSSHMGVNQAISDVSTGMRSGK
jgi:hypothetical protein